jgi:hypothetical protein
MTDVSMATLVILVPPILFPQRTEWENGAGLLGLNFLAVVFSARLERSTKLLEKLRLLG